MDHAALAGFLRRRREEVAALFTEAWHAS